MLLLAFMKLHRGKLLVWEFCIVNKLHSLFQNSLVNPVLGLIIGEILFSQGKQMISEVESR